jgi:LPS sulfotransferase NodH
MERDARSSFLICCAPRSGSYLLGEALQSAGIGGKSVEYFGPNFEPDIRALVGGQHETYRGLLSKILEYGTSPTGVFGAKAHWFQLDSFAARLAAEARCDKRVAFHTIIDSFPNLKCIWLRRRDTIRQAISYDRAAQTNVWWNIDGATPAPVAQERFDFRSINERLKTIEDCDAGWQEFFTDYRVAPLVVWYEDFVASYRATVESVAKFIGHHIAEARPLPEPRMQQQADALTDQWVKQYQDCLSASSRLA